MEDKVTALEKKLDRVIFYLEDDKSTGKIGVIRNIDKLNERLQKLEEDKNKLTTIAATFGFIGSSAAGVVYFILKVLNIIK